MIKKLGVVMDPIATIHREKDSTFAMLLEAQTRGYELYYFEQKDLFLQDGIPYGNARLLSVQDDANHWFDFHAEKCVALADCNVILMRKDPPFNEEYIYTTYILEHAEKLGALVVNRPQALRDANEKMFTTHFPEFMPKTLVTSSIAMLHDFWREHEDIVCKPLHGMGGVSVFRLRKDDVNANAIFDTLTHSGKSYIMAQKFVPEISAGDKRVLMIDGEPVPFVLARIPSKNDWRGNLAVGATGVVQPITEGELKICRQVGPKLRELGLYFVGLDIIGSYLTEVNVTSPTCIREITKGSGLDITAQLFDAIEKYL